MQVWNVMKTKAVCVTAETPAKEAYEMMRQGGFRHLPVIDGGGHLVGIVSDRDILNVAVMFEKRPQRAEDYLISDEVTVQEVMTADPVAVLPSTDLAEVVGLMTERGISALPVVEEQKVVGIVTVSDLLRLLRKFLSGS